MLEHVPDPASTVAACARLVKPGGQVFLSTLNRNAKAYVVAVLGAEYLLQLLPRGTHDYSRFLKPAELARFAARPGLEVLEITGLRYNPFRAKAWSAPIPTSITCCGRSAVPEAVLFDLDGTLADTAPDLGGALNRTCCRNRGATRCRWKVAAACLVGRARHDRRRTRHHAGRRRLPRPAAALSSPFTRTHSASAPACSPAWPNTWRTGARGIPWGIVTNKSQRFAIPLMEGLGLRQRCVCIVCGDSARRAKPHGHPMQLASAVIGIAPGAASTSATTSAM
jgi:beta-phosphoglucomutase-like phosphatase (HAD superfamily)